MTENLHFATGIANIYHRLPGVTRQASWPLAEQSNGRFLLGLGISHAPLVEGLRQIPYGVHRNNAIVSPFSFLSMHLYPTKSGTTMCSCSIGATNTTTIWHLILQMEKTILIGQLQNTLIKLEKYLEKINYYALSKGCLTEDKQTAYSAAKSALRIYASLQIIAIVGSSWDSQKNNDIDTASDHFIDSWLPWGSIQQIEKRIKNMRKLELATSVFKRFHMMETSKSPEWETFEAFAPYCSSQHTI